MLAAKLTPTQIMTAKNVFMDIPMRNNRRSCAPDTAPVPVPFQSG
jgi:hypothetical protein